MTVYRCMKQSTYPCLVIKTRCEPQVVAISAILGICTFVAIHQITANKTTTFTEYQLSSHVELQSIACVELQALTLQAYTPTTEGLLGTQS